MESLESKKFIRTLLSLVLVLGVFLNISTQTSASSHNEHDDHDEHEYNEDLDNLIDMNNLIDMKFGMGGANVQELSKQIDDYADRIRQIDKEIEEQRKLIQGTSAKAGEISAQIKLLSATKNKLQSDISRTQNVISKSNLEIEKIDIEMTDKERKIASTQKGLAESLRNINQNSEKAFIELMFDSKTVSEFVEEILEIRKFKEILINTKYNLLDLNRELSQKKAEEERTKEELEKEKKILAGQQSTVISTQNAQSSLLSATKSEQSKYEALLKDKEAQRKQFETLLRDIESQIKILIDPGTFPTASKGVLGWPLANIIVTQQFGGSDFAKQNPGIYGRAYHPGTDFGVPIGSKVMSVEAGVIKGQDNTDAYPGCYAWGRWIVVEHDNGLSSMYAHLSSSLVNTGQRVAKGEIIALSGNTGISTGPHLHLSLYATQGLRIGKYGTYKPGGSGCAATNASGPFADLSAYLDPMTYLPN